MKVTNFYHHGLICLNVAKQCGFVIGLSSLTQAYCFIFQDAYNSVSSSVI